MSSLQRQLNLGLTLGLILIMTLLWWGGSRAIETLTEHFVLSRLNHDSDALLSAFTLDSQGQPKLDQRRIPPLFEQPYSGHYYRFVLGQSKKLDSRSLWDFQLDIPVLAAGTQRHWRGKGPNGQLLLISAAGFLKTGHSFTLAVTEDMAPLERRLADFQWLFAGLAATSLVLLLLLQGLILKRAFCQLKPLGRQLKQLEAGALRSVSEQVPSEIQPLVRQLNRLLELMQQRLDHSRNGLGNLAHALKGPLNILLQQLETPAIALEPELKQSLGTQVERIRQLIERELKRARMAGQGVPGSLFDPDDDLPALIGLMQQMHSRKGIRIHGEWPKSGALPIDREDLHELLGNLLDNACKWAQSEVWLELQWQQGLSLVVEDDGPGVAAAELTQLAGRGVRVDESVSGHGLGLAICTDLVKGYGGKLEFESSARLGGLKVLVWLPAPLAQSES